MNEVAELAVFDDVMEDLLQEALDDPPPLPATPFPQLAVRTCVRVDGCQVKLPPSGHVVTLKNVVFDAADQNEQPDMAYWVGRELDIEWQHGRVREAKILVRLENPEDNQVRWADSGQWAFCYVYKGERTNSGDFGHPLYEASVLQYLEYRAGEKHPNVACVLDAFIENYGERNQKEVSYVFLPHYDSGELVSRVIGTSGVGMVEDLARFWFLQVLKGFSHLHDSLVSHRNFSLDHVLVHRSQFAVVSNLGCCVGIPSDGVSLRMLPPMSPSGEIELFYVPPEIIRGEPFDAFGVDVWALGVSLFVLLVGLPPWEMATEDDSAYRRIQNGDLSNMLRETDRLLPQAAINLLEGMLQDDPRRRLSISEIANNDWVTGIEDIDLDNFNLIPMDEEEEWRAAFPL